nr:uncharacterized protein LOC116775248 [Danaus plexippus plexippus]
MAWLWLFSYIFIVVMILKINNALDLATFSKFVENFHKLVEEMSIYFEPCGFPIELVERCQRDSQYAQQEIVRLTESMNIPWIHRADAGSIALLGEELQRCLGLATQV